MRKCWLLQYMREHHLDDWNQVAFLFRLVCWDKAKSLANYLEEHNIPVYAPRSDLYFGRDEVRLLIGALLFLFPVFKEIRDEWAAKFADLVVWIYDEVLFFAEQLRVQQNKELRDWCVHRVRNPWMLMNNQPRHGFRFFLLFYQLLQFPLFSQFLELKHSSRDERPARNVAIFSQLIVKFEYLHHIQVLHPTYLKKNVQDLFNHYLRYLEDGGITEFEDADDSTPQGAVAFMTIHQAKGLEFPVTVVSSPPCTSNVNNYMQILMRSFRISTIK